MMKLKYVYCLTTLNVMGKSGRFVSRTGAMGTGHIFRVDSNGELAYHSLCGKKQSDIGNRTVKMDGVDPNLPVCQECADAWKADPQGPWAKWLKSVEQQ